MTAARHDADALVVGLAIVPHLYSRNRMFALFQRPEVRRARVRAAQIRGVVRQLAEARAVAEIREWTRGPIDARLVYRIAAVGFERRLDLSAIEAACLAWLAARAGLAAPAPTAEDRAAVEAALRRLGGDVLRVATEGRDRASDAGTLAAHDERHVPLLQDPARRDTRPEGARD